MAAKSHIAKLEALQSIILRAVTNTQQYVRNDEIRKGLKIKTDEITSHCDRYKKRIDNHPNDLAKELCVTSPADCTGSIQMIYPNDIKS